MKINELIKREEIQISHDWWDSKAETTICSNCGYVTRFWYVTIFNAEGDYLDSVQSRRCIRCAKEVFFDEDGNEPEYTEGELRASYIYSSN